MTKEYISRWQFDLMKKTLKGRKTPDGVSLEKWLNTRMDIWVEPKQKIQAKHIPDATMLLVIKQLEGIPHISVWGDKIRIFEPQSYTTVYLQDIQNLYPKVPPKVILAKLKGLIKRGLIDGCPCGCRGDFKVIKKEAMVLK